MTKCKTVLTVLKSFVMLFGVAIVCVTSTRLRSVLPRLMDMVQFVLGMWSSDWALSNGLGRKGFSCENNWDFVD